MGLRAKALLNLHLPLGSAPSPVWIWIHSLQPHSYLVSWEGQWLMSSHPEVLRTPCIPAPWVTSQSAMEFWQPAPETWPRLLHLLPLSWAHTSLIQFPLQPTPASGLPPSYSYLLGWRVPRRKGPERAGRDPMWWVEDASDWGCSGALGRIQVVGEKVT